METAHRRIELQSPADLHYLYANATQSATQKLDLHFPPSAAPRDGEDADDMRRRVEALVMTYIQAAFEAVKSNISVNGLVGDEMRQELDKTAPDQGTTSPLVRGQC